MKEGQAEMESLNNLNIKKRDFDLDIQAISSYFWNMKKYNLKMYNGAVFTCASTNCDTLLFPHENFNDVLSINPSFQGKYLFPEEIGPDSGECLCKIRKATKYDFRGELKYTPKSAICLELTFSFHLRNKTNCYSLKIPLVQHYNLWDDKRPWSENIDNVWEVIGGRWKPQDRRGRFREIKYYAFMASSQAADDLFSWKVKCQLPEWPISISFPINRDNIKDVFKLRDIPNGESRRKALKNIINSYSRRKPRSEDSVEVIKHFRNQSQFSIDGILAEIVPSYDDVDLIKRLQQKRRNIDGYSMPKK